MTVEQLCLVLKVGPFELERVHLFVTTMEEVKDTRPKRLNADMETGHDSLKANETVFEYASNDTEKTYNVIVFLTRNKLSEEHENDENEQQQLKQQYVCTLIPISLT